MANDKDFVVNGPVVVGKDTKVTVGTITASAIDLSTGNYFAETLTADTTYTLSNAGAVQAFQLEVTGGAIGYDISAGVYDNISLSITSQTPSPFDIAFNNDGTKMYTLNNTAADHLYQYSLSTAYDLSTASYDSISLSISSQETNPYGFTFKNDGSKLYVVGTTSDSVHQYSLSTAYDLSTASYDSVSFNFSGQTGSPVDVTFKPDGTKMYVPELGSHIIYQYSLSTAWDVGTASYDSVSLAVSSQSTNPRSVSFNATGVKMYVLGKDQLSIFQYNLSTAYDLSTASYGSLSLSVSEATGPEGFVFNNDGSKIYVLSNNTDTVYQYSTSVDALLTWPSSIEWAAGIAPAAPANGETDVFTFTTDDGGTIYTGVKSIDNAS